MINQDLLHRYADAFVMYEIANHGVNPRETLEGTSFRITNNEGYKYLVIDEWKRLMERVRIGELYYAEAVIKIFPGINLVDPHFPIVKLRTPQFEEAVRELYKGNADQAAFMNIVRVLGGTFDMIGFLFFLKDPEVYMPIRSTNFDKRFSYLQIDSRLAGRCTWETYQQYNAWIGEIHDYLREHVNPAITKIDAHSFLWIIGGLDKQADAWAVEHKKFGKGVIVGEPDGENIRIKFGKEVRTFNRMTALAGGMLKFIPSRYDIYGNLIDVMPVDKETKKINQEADEKLVADLRAGMEESAASEIYTGKPRPKPEPVWIKGKTTYPRARRVAWNALTHADFKCELNPWHETFIRKNSDKPYTEPHHLVPMEYQDQFENVSLDTEENIVSLCSNCHNQIHYGRDYEPIIKKLFEERRELLKSIGIEISVEALLRMYE